MENIGIGTELKLNINIQPINGFTMDDYDFVVDVYCKPKNTVTVTKAECIRVDKDNYIVCFDSEMLGQGDIKCKVTAYIPDRDFSDGLRTEVAFLETGITIIKSI